MKTEQLHLSEQKMTFIVPRNLSDGTRQLSAVIVRCVGCLEDLQQWGYTKRVLLPLEKSKKSVSLPRVVSSPEKYVVSLTLNFFFFFQIYCLLLTVFTFHNFLI